MNVKVNKLKLPLYDRVHENNIVNLRIHAPLYELLFFLLVLLCTNLKRAKKLLKT